MPSCVGVPHHLEDTDLDPHHVVYKKKKSKKFSLKTINGWQQDSLTAFRERFQAKSNCEALDKIDSLKLEIESMYHDAIKYPQLGLHEQHLERLERMMELFKKL